jgi:transposase
MKKSVSRKSSQPCSPRTPEAEAPRPAVLNGPLFIGLDVGDKQVSFHVLDGLGKCVGMGDFKTLPEEVDRFAARFSGAKAVLEACGHSGWMSRRLIAAGMETTVCKADVLCGPRRRKNDQRDALELADLLRTASRRLQPVYVRSAALQNESATLTARDALVACRATLIHTARGLVKTAGARLPVCDASTFAVKARPAVPAELADALLPLIAQIQSLTDAIRGHDRLIEKAIEQRHPAAARLRAVPGVGPITALSFVLAVGDAKRFLKSRDVGAYFGLAPGQKASGEASPQMPISKAGNETIRRLLVQCAHYILGPFGQDSDLRTWGLGLAKRGGKAAKKRAAVAVARRLGVLLLALWKSERDYDPHYRSRRTAA